MNEFEMWSVGLTAITLIITIVGWWRTAVLQKGLLERQVAADEAKTRLSIRVPRRIDQLDKIQAWVTETERLRRHVSFLGSDPLERNQAIADFKKWETQFFTEIRHIAPVLDADLDNLLRQYSSGENYFMTLVLTGRSSTAEDRQINSQTMEIRERLRTKLTELERTLPEN